MISDQDTVRYTDLRLSRVSLEHIPALFALTQQNRAFLRQWLPWLDLVSCQVDTEAYVINSMAAADRGERYNYALFYRDQLAGVIGLYDVNPINRRAAIGYWLSEDKNGLGLMTEAVRRMTVKGFGDFGLNRIEVYCATENHGSRAVPERLGFEFEGILRQHEWLYTRFVDHALYAMTRDQRGRLQ